MQHRRRLQGIRRPARRHSLRPGVVTLEVILFLPILFIGLLAVVEFAIIMQASKQVSYASRFGAKIASEAPRASSSNPYLGNINDPTATTPPPAGESLKERVDQYLANHGLTASCQVVLEHNASGVAGATQSNPDPAPAGCDCEVPTTALRPAMSMCV